MRFGRTVAPAAAPIGFRDLAHGILALVRPGPYRRRLEDDLRRALGAEHVFLVSSGRAGLVLALRALATLSPRRAVVVPAYTCFSVPSAVVRAGMRVVLCDVDPETLDFDYTALERLLREEPLAIVAPHLLGVPADTGRLRRCCQRAGVFVIEDAAQAFGGEAGGRLLGTSGEIGVFSFGRGKAVSSEGGGLLVARGATIASAVAHEVDRVRRPGVAASLRDLAVAAGTSVFIRPALFGVPASLPFLGLGETRFDPAFVVTGMSRAKIGLLYRWRSRLTKHQHERAANVGWFEARLAPERSRPEAQPCIRLAVLVADRAARDGILDRARTMGLGLSPLYPSCLAEIDALEADPRDFPGARRLAATLLTIPTHELVTEHDRRAIVRLLEGRVVTIPGRRPATAALAS